MLSRVNIKELCTSLGMMYDGIVCHIALFNVGFLHPIGGVVAPFFVQQYAQNDFKKKLLITVLVHTGATVLYAGAKWLVRKMRIEEITTRERGQPSFIVKNALPNDEEN